MKKKQQNSKIKPNSTKKYIDIDFIKSVRVSFVGKNNLFIAKYKAYHSKSKRQFKRGYNKQKEIGKRKLAKRNSRKRNFLPRSTGRLETYQKELKETTNFGNTVET